MLIDRRIDIVLNNSYYFRVNKRSYRKPCIQLKENERFWFSTTTKRLFLHFMINPRKWDEIKLRKRDKTLLLFLKAVKFNNIPMHLIYLHYLLFALASQHSLSFSLLISKLSHAWSIRTLQINSKLFSFLFQNDNHFFFDCIFYSVTFPHILI